VYGFILNILYFIIVSSIFFNYFAFYNKGIIKYLISVILPWRENSKAKINVPTSVKECADLAIIADSVMTDFFSYI
jgi:hypothetical protein